MIGKIKSSLLGVLCAVCLQVPMNVGAVDLLIVFTNLNQYLFVGNKQRMKTIINIINKSLTKPVIFFA